jgi:hypothetical protein
MEKEFVPYNFALRMKALGFDEPCFGFYKLGDIDIYYDTILQGNKHKFRNNTQLNFYGDLKEKISAPTFSQAFRWFREEYDLHLLPSKNVNKWWATFGSWTSEVYDSYEEAELACLEKLIEIVKNK